MENLYLISGIGMFVLALIAAIAGFFGKTFLRPVRDSITKLDTNVGKIADDLATTREDVAHVKGQMDVILNPRKAYH